MADYRDTTNLPVYPESLDPEDTHLNLVNVDFPDGQHFIWDEGVWVAVETSYGGLSTAGASPYAVDIYGMPLATGVSFPSGFASGVVQGDTDLYTVPTGRKAFVLTYAVYNTSLGNILWTPQVKIAGTYYACASRSTVATVAAGTSGATPIILNAGEILSVHTETTDGLNIWPQIIEFDDTVPISREGVLSPASGVNTLYTVPVGKTAAIISQRPMDSLSATMSVNATAGSLNVSVYYVPSGGSVGAASLASPSAALAAHTGIATTVRATLEAGDSVVVNWSGANANGLSWVNVVER